MIPLVLSLLSKDRTDAVLALSTVVSEHGAQWRDTQITRSNGYITGMAALMVPKEKLEALIAAATALPDTQVLTSVGALVDEVVPNVMQMNVLGPDREPLVRELLAALSGLGLQVRELRTHHHVVEDESFFGATLMLAVGTPTPDLPERAVAAAGQVGLSADAEMIFSGLE